MRKAATTVVTKKGTSRARVARRRHSVDEAANAAKDPKRSRTSPGGLDLETADTAGEVQDGVSSLQDDSSVQHNLMEEKWKKLDERLQSMEDKDTSRDRRMGEVSVVSGGGAEISPPENEMILKENLRKFVAGKVFPSWKFIFKKELLEKCVVAAVGKSFITIPPGFNQNQLAERYSQIVRGCLDGCRANAQTAARKRYLSK